MSDNRGRKTISEEVEWNGMRIFALETDIRRIVPQYLTGGEREVLIAYHHWLVFLVEVLRQSMVFLAVCLIGYVVQQLGVPSIWPAGLVAFVFLFWNLPRLIRSYIDWHYDVLLVTTDKIVLIDQSSIIRQRVTKMSLDNIASVTMETQWLNTFPFGCVRFNLKEGFGGEFALQYIPNAATIVVKISDVITQFERRE